MYVAVDIITQLWNCFRLCCKMVGPKQLDFMNAVVDEIALEGLDGITIEGKHWIQCSR